MRAICKVCKDNDTCSYLKRGKESDCIDVQTSDYGYEEAVNKSAEWMKNHNAGEEVIEQYVKDMEE